MRAVHSHHSLRCDAKEAFGAATALWGRLAETGFDVSFCLQPVESGIDGANRNFAASARLDFLAHRNSVGIVMEPHEPQNDYIFETAEMIPIHYIYNSELISFVNMDGPPRGWVFRSCPKRGDLPIALV